MQDSTFFYHTLRFFFFYHFHVMLYQKKEVFLANEMHPVSAITEMGQNLLIS